MAKLHAAENHGELWLSGLPTKDMAEWCWEHRITIQVCCLRKDPVEVFVGHGAHKKQGIRVPGARLCRVELSNPHARGPGFLQALQLLQQSLPAGDSALVHCKAGVHRAATVAVGLRARLCNEDWDFALEAVNNVRNVEVAKVLEDMSAPATWLRLMKRSSGVIPPLWRSWCVASTPNAVVHGIADDGAPMCRRHLRRDAVELSGQAKESWHLSEAIIWSRPFCKQCLLRMPASVQLTVADLPLAAFR